LEAVNPDPGKPIKKKRIAGGPQHAVNRENAFTVSRRHLPFPSWLTGIRGLDEWFI
jgi:hypothetical protein